MTIEELYAGRCRTPHNIDQHLPLLRELAAECQSVTEFGTDIGFSTTAFLASGCPEVHSYDLVETGFVEILRHLAVGAGVSYTFHQADTLRCPLIAPTDLLLVDSDHTDAQVRGELARHGHQVRRYLVFHDTVSFPAIVPAIEQYTAEGWEQVCWREWQHGLAVYRRLP